VGNEAAAVPAVVEPHTVRLAAPDGYPPREKVFEMWKTLHDDFYGYDWYMKVDIDAYINAETLSRLVDDLVSRETTVGYFGKAGAGREFERDKLGLNGPFCMGMGYMMGRTTLVALRQELDWCFANPHSDHSDTEIGNCNYRASNILCEDARITGESGTELFVNFYYSSEDNGRVSSAQVKEDNDGQVTSSHSAYFGDPLEAVLVHPLKSPSLMQTLHRQVTRNLRPLLKPLWMEDRSESLGRLYLRPNKGSSKFTAAEKQAVRFFEKACVNNPQEQVADTGIHMKECELMRHEETASISSLSTIVLGENVAAVEERFSHTSLSLKSFKGSALALFQDALLSGTKLLLVLDGDAIPHDDFDTRLLYLLRDERCAGHLFSQRAGGALLLQATPGLGEVRKSVCTNWRQGKLSSGTIYHQNTFQAIIDWLDSQSENLSSPEDFGWGSVYAHLTKLGYVTRVATDSIVL